MKEFCSPVPFDTKGELVVHASSDIRPSNIFNGPNFEKVDDILVFFGTCLLVCLSVHLCVGYACTRSITIRDRILKFNIWNNFANKMTIFSFSLH